MERELDILRDRLLLMGGEAELAVQRAMHALVQRDSPVAEQVLEHDTVIDRLELEIDRLSVDVMTLRRPVGRELRLVISIFKITPILERIADHASSIARAALELNDEPELKSYGELSQMAEHALEMLQSALDAFTTNDAERARELIKKMRKSTASTTISLTAGWKRCRRTQANQSVWHVCCSSPKTSSASPITSKTSAS